mmetsp:Transcript_5010/g.12285  ORF Transcript_5010/g.12285 Transcript_5010/m.12285 type:complete len:457 (+) Transcript_5010:16-1386(+)
MLRGTQTFHRSYALDAPDALGDVQLPVDAVAVFTALAAGFALARVMPRRRHRFPAALPEEIQGDFTQHPGSVYLDCAATSKKPHVVIRTLADAVLHDANVHRGSYGAAAAATAAYEKARAVVLSFIGAPRDGAVIFTRNATASINLVARSWADSRLGPGDEILATVAEHHSNLVPWQQVSRHTGCTLSVVGLTADSSEVNLDELLSSITPRTRLVVVSGASNVLGSALPLHVVGERARAVGARLLVDGCQSVPHCLPDMTAVDWLAFSAHKACGPMGVGVLWTDGNVLKEMQPVEFGGGMVESVSASDSVFAPAPYCFEPGTPPVAETVATAAALQYYERVGVHRIQAYEKELAAHLYRKLSAVSGVTVLGPRSDRLPLAAVSVQGLDPQDMGLLMDQLAGVSVRSGHHCAEPLHRALGLSGSLRFSGQFYTSFRDVDLGVEALREAINLLRSGNR